MKDCLIAGTTDREWAAEDELMSAIRRAIRYARVWRPKTAREIRLMWRCKPVDRIVRWIGAPGRRRAGSVRNISAERASVPSQAPADNVVSLTWAQTYGRPAEQG
jgi:hypothetical protein